MTEKEKEGHQKTDKTTKNLESIWNENSAIKLAPKGTQMTKWVQKAINTTPLNQA